MSETELIPRVLLPRRVHDALEAGTEHESFESVALFVDLSGFSAMSERLMVRGQHGAELLAQALRDFFGPHVATVQDHGGFVVGFAGDAFTALFPMASLGEAAALRALAAAEGIARDVAEAPVRSVGGEDFGFAVKLGIGRGLARWRWHAASRQVLFSGSALWAAAAAEHQAERGEIVAHHDIVRCLPGGLSWEDRGPAHCRLVGDARLPPLRQPSRPWTPDLALLRRCFPEALLDPDRSAEFRWVVSIFMALDVGDSEDALVEFLGIAAPLCQQWGGHLDRVDVGDKGCTAVWYWGAPVAVEKDVERAADFLLELRTALRASGGPPLRAGLTHHRMYVGFAGHPRREAMSCYGGGVTLAARLCMAAPWGDIWVDRNAARGLVDHALLAEREPRRLKGYTEPVPAWVLEGKAASLPSVRPLSGRADELAALRRHLGTLGSKSAPFAGGIVLLGRPGVGKSHLVAVARAELGPGVCWVTGACDAVHQPALHPFLGLVEALLGIAAGSGPERRQSLRQGLERVLRAHADAHTDHEEVLAGWLGLGMPGALWDRLDPRSRARRLRTSLQWLLEQVVRHTPLVVHIEDIHWLDAESRRFLGALRAAAEEESWPLALVFTSRPTAGGGPAAPWEGEQPICLALDGLDPEDIQGVVTDALGQACSPSLALHLHRRSHGNPFFSQQLALALRESGRLAAGEDGLALEQGAGDRLPARIDQILVARLDALGRRVRRAVLGAAVLGLVFHPALHDQLLDERAGGLRQEAARQGVLVADGDEAWRFTHGLMRDAAYEMQLVSQRRAAHHRAAEALRQTHDDTGRFQAQIAWHFDKAGDVNAALRHLDRARAHARSVYDLADAVRHCQRIRVLTRDLTDPDWQDLRYSSIAMEVNLSQRLGRSQEAIERLAAELGAADPGLRGLLSVREAMLAPGPGRTERVRVLLEWMMTLRRIERCGPEHWSAMEGIREVLASEAPGGHAYQATMALTLRYLSIFALQVGRQDDCLALSEQVLALMEQGYEEANRGSVLHSMAIAAKRKGNLPKALQLVHEAVGVFREQGQLHFLHLSLNLMGNLCALRGELLLATEAFGESSRVGRLAGAAALRFMAPRGLIEIALIRGDIDRAGQELDRIWAESSKSRRDRVRMARLRSKLLRLVGEPGEALPVIQAAQREATVEAPNVRLMFELEEVECLLALGRTDEANAALAAATLTCEEGQGGDSDGDVAVLRARLSTPAEAIAIVTPWVRTWRRSGGRLALASALLVRARAALALGDVVRFEADCGEVVGLIEEMALLPPSELARGLASLQSDRRALA